MQLELDKIPLHIVRFFSFFLVVIKFALIFFNF